MLPPRSAGHPGATRSVRRSAGLTLCSFAVALTLIAALLANAPSARAAFLSFVELKRDGVAGVDGLDGTFAVSVSPDGSNLYAASRFDSAVAVFGRSSLTGGLTFVEALKQGVGGINGLSGATSLAVSPDGAHVYVAGLNSNSVAAFARSPATGALTLLEVEQDGVGGVDGLEGAISVALSPDGSYLYAAGFEEAAIVAFSRNPGSGALTFLDVYRDGVGGADGIQQPIFITVSPDNSHVYVGGVSANDGIALYSRSTTSGSLTFVELYPSFGSIDGLTGGQSIAFSPDGLSAYVASSTSLIGFSREPTTGRLSHLETFRDSFNGVDGLLGAVSVAVSPDGNTVYVASQSDSAVAVFSRNLSTGRLLFVEAQKDGLGGVDGLDIAQAVAVSPDSKHVYTGSQIDDAVAVFSAAGAQVATPTATATATATTNPAPTATPTARGLYLPLVLEQEPPTATATPTATLPPSPTATPPATATASPTRVPGAALTLYLCYDQQRNPEEFLSAQPCPIDNMQLFVYAGTSLESRSFEYPLTGDIAGTTYTFEVLLASRGTTNFTVSAILRRGGVESTLASTTFTARSTTFQPFVATVAGQDPTAASGDTLIVRVRSTSGSDAAMLIAQSRQTFLKIE
jgi:6-phosphogluconolactonase (cycloisomerase 2 family)